MAETYHTLRQHHRRKPPLLHANSQHTDDSIVTNIVETQTKSYCNQNRLQHRRQQQQQQKSQHFQFDWINNLVIVVICSLLFLHTSLAQTTPATEVRILHFYTYIACTQYQCKRRNDSYIKKMINFLLLLKLYIWFFSLRVLWL